jgi:ribosomal-protein-alanine N-acetyltransferase
VPELETPNLLLVPTTLRVLRTRLEADSFEADVPVGGGTVRVVFPTGWPRDALAISPVMIEQPEREPDVESWGGTLVDRADRVAVGQIGFKAPPDARGVAGIGYGVNPSYQGRGYATEAVRALVAWASGQPGVRRVTAECRTDNVGSTRVLEKRGSRGPVAGPTRRKGTCSSGSTGLDH